MPAFGITFVSDTDVTDPIAGVSCRQVVIPGSTPSVTKWNSALRILRYILEL